MASRSEALDPARAAEGYASGGAAGVAAGGDLTSAREAATASGAEDFTDS